MTRRIKSAIALAVAVCVLCGCATPSQMIADHKMEEMCAKDGGMQVFQTVELPADEYDFSNNEPKGLFAVISGCNGTHRPFGKNYTAMCNYELVDGNKNSIYIMKSVLELRDSENDLTLGRKVHYIRFGGNFPLTTAEPTGERCPKFTQGLVDAVFHVKGGAK